MAEQIPLSEDMIEGADAIAREINTKTDRATRLLEGGILPGFKLGGRWHARRSTLRSHIERLERGEAV
jgi:hypothetical protein